jgi:uncharacterized phage-associated protein
MRSVADTQFTLRGAPAALIALLAAARAQGAIITRVKLAKLLYLADLRAVQELGGPGSGVEWRWWHYGPYSKLLLAVEDDLVSARVIEREVTENYYGSTEYRLRLGREVPVDVNAQFAVIIEDVVLRYGNLAASSLRDLTYQTRPMREAQREDARGEILDLLTGHPVPRIAPVLAQFQEVLDGLGAQEDEGDISALSDEIADWAPLRARAVASEVNAGRDAQVAGGNITNYYPAADTGALGELSAGEGTKLLSELARDDDTLSRARRVLTSVPADVAASALRVLLRRDEDAAISPRHH